MTCRLTGRGVTVLAGGGGLLAAGLLLGYPALTGLGVAAAAALTLAVAATWPGSKVTVERAVRPDRVTVGEPATVQLTLRPSGRLPAYGFDAVEHVDGEPWRVPVPAHVSGTAPAVTLTVPTPRRGLVRLGPVTIERRDPLALVRRSRPVTGHAWLWVRPRVHPARSLPLGVVLDFEGRLTDQAPAGSTAFTSLREYLPGDDPRHIHWRSSARAGTLVVREHVDTTDPAVAIVLDTRAELFDEPTFEAAVEVAASIAAATRRAGRQVTLAAPGEDRVAAARAGGVEVADRLAALTRTHDSDGTELARLVDRAPPGGTLVVLSAPAPGLVARLTPARRRFTQVVAVLLHQVEAAGTVRRSGMAVLHASSAPAAVAAWSRYAAGGHG